MNTHFSRKALLLCAGAMGAIAFTASAHATEPGLVLSDASLKLVEPSSTKPLSIALRAAPTADVTVTLTASDPGEVMTRTTTLTFTPAKWRTPQIVKVQAVDDTATDGAQKSKITYTITSADPAYDGLSVTPLEVTTLDNDQRNFTVSGLPVAVSEKGTSQTLTVKLNHEPSYPVILNIKPMDKTEIAASPASITITPENWQTAQTITITGVDDEAKDGDQETKLAILADAASDPAYRLTRKYIRITTKDDESEELVGGGGGDGGGKPAPLVAPSAVRTAFTAQTTGFLARRVELMGSQTPDMASSRGSHGEMNALAINDENGAVTGNYALSGGGAGQMLNVWAEGRFAFYRDAGPATDEADGNFFIGNMGLGLNLSENLTLGLMAGLDWLDEELAGGSTDGKGWMVGPYMSLSPAADTTLDLRALWGRSRNDVASVISGTEFDGEFDTSRMLVEGRFSTRFDMGSLAVTPDASLLWLREEQDGYSATAGAQSIAIDGRDVKLGQLSGGLNIAHTSEAGNAMVSPYVETRLFWAFDNPEMTTSAGGVASEDDLRAAVSAGVNVTSGATRFNVEARYDGLISDGMNAWGGRVGVSHQF